MSITEIESQPPPVLEWQAKTYTDAETGEPYQNYWVIGEVIELHIDHIVRSNHAGCSAYSIEINLIDEEDYWNTTIIREDVTAPRPEDAQAYAESLLRDWIKRCNGIWGPIGKEHE